MNEQAPDDLRVEYLIEPIGVGTRAPRFSWATRGEQRAYELVVEPQTPVRESSSWSSGRVESTESSLVEYRGDPLASNTAYRWRVRIWTDADADATATEWASSFFETALLDPADWRAGWIVPDQRPTATEHWTLFDWITGKQPDTPVAERLRPPQLLRQVFPVDDGLVRARLFATAHGTYQAYCNGSPADDQVLAPGFDSYRHRVSAQAYDLTAMLVPGDNVLAFVLADGWWAGRIGLSGSSAQFGDETAAIWQLELEYLDGRRSTVTSGSDVVSSTGPWEYADLFIGERFDRRAEPDGWQLPGFDTIDWRPVTVSQDLDVSTIVPFLGEPVRVVQTLAPVATSGEPGDGVVVDFGQVIAGRVRLRLPAARPGQVVTLEHTETLAADGSWFVNIAGINKEQTDVYVAVGIPGGEVYEPMFSFHGFRYVRITGLDTAPHAVDVTASVLASDIEQTGAFTSSDARLNRLHDNVVWSQRANFLSIPTDCPQRERAGWTGDLQVFAPAAANNAQIVPFVSRWLANVRADQLPDGRIPIMSPYSPWDAQSAAAGQGFGGIVAAAGWSDAIAIVPWLLYERTGDRRVLEENFDAMRRWAEYQRTAAAADMPPALAAESPSPERLARQALLWNTGEQFGDWLTPSTLEGRPLHEAIGIAPRLTGELVGPMFQIRTLDVIASAASVLGEVEVATEAVARAGAVRAAFAAEYIDEDGRLPVDLQGMYVLALAFDLVPSPLRAASATRLASLIEQRDGRLDTGFLSVPHLLDVLWDTGNRDLARRVLWQPAMPSWLYEVDHGATTIWESWDAVGEDGTVRTVSLNHYAFGCVDDWLYRRMAGIRSTSPGYRTVVVEPDFDGGPDSVSAHVGTPYGRLAVAWQRAGDTAEVRTDIPFGVTAVLRGPDRDVPLVPGTTTHHLGLAHTTPETTP